MSAAVTVYRRPADQGHPGGLQPSAPQLFFLFSSFIMKSSVSLLLVVLFPFADGAVPCDHQDAIQSMECKPLLGNLAGEMAKHADMPPPDELKQFSDMCEQALTCMEKIKCDVLKNATVLIAKTCTGINLMSGPFGKCIDDLRSTPPSLKKYPCARFLQTELGRPGNCQMYQDELECTTKLTTDRCGLEAVEAMEKNMGYILGMMECS